MGKIKKSWDSPAVETLDDYSVSDQNILGIMLGIPRRLMIPVFAYAKGN